MNPEKVERLVLLASDATSSEQQWEATNILNAWVLSKDPAVASCLLQVLVSSQQEAVLFYALTTMQRFSLTFQERIQLRNYLIHFSANPDYLKTKAAVVLALLIKRDYPNRWPLAFQEVHDQATPEILLRTLLVLMEELVQNDEEAVRVKDVTRGFGQDIPLESTVAAQIMGWLVDILSTFFPLVASPSATHPNQSAHVLCALSFQVLKQLVSWVDLALLMNDRVLDLVFAGIQGFSVSIAVPAVETLEELVGRGMPAERKILMLSKLNLLQRIHDSRVDLNAVDVSPIEVVIEVATLVNSTGEELLILWDAADLSVNRHEYEILSTMLQQLMDLFFRCFAYDDIDVSAAVIPLASALTVALGEETSKAATTNGNANRYFTVAPHMTQLLAVMFHQMRYPEDFEFDYENDDEAEEEVYRAELRKLNQAIVRINPDLSLQFLCEALSNLPMPVSSCPTRDIEASLRLVYHYCEGIRPPPGMKVVMRNETFCALLVALHQSDVASHEHREVVLLYYDICVRYYPIFKKRPELLPTVLESMSGPRGLQHQNARVRTRSAYLLLRLVKSLRKVLRPFVETAVTGIQGLLASPNTLPLRQDDVLCLFETIGFLLGKTGLEPTEQQKWLTQVMTPHVLSIEDILLSSDLQRDPERFGCALSESIAAIAYLSKGFNQPSREVQLVLLETVSVTLGVLEALPGNEGVRNKTMIFLQRMILCLANEVLVSMPRFLAILIEHCTSQDVLDVAQLLNQLCLKFGENAVPTLDGAILPFLRKCHNLMPSSSQVVDQNDSIPPHLVAEQLSVKKLTFAFLQHVVTNRAAAVLLTATNVNALESILTAMLDGASAVQDPVVKKSCIAFFRELIEQWSDPNSPIMQEHAAVQRGFVQFVFELFLPGMVKCLLRPNFDEKDAMQARNVSEMANILVLLKQKRGNDEFERFITVGCFTTAVQCPPTTLQGYRTASNTKEMEFCLREMITTMKYT